MANTIHTLNKKVEKGLEIAREYAADDPELLAFLDILELSYNSRRDDMLVLAINIWAFMDRDKETALAWMREKRKQVNEAKIPNTNARSELIN